jgi:DNA-binding transcriptional regulator YdaS (Cro superfamily)
MTLSEYFKDEPIGAKKEMAEYLGITQAWMASIISGKGLCSAYLAKRIEEATQGLVTRKEIRPGLFGD